MNRVQRFPSVLVIHWRRALKDKLSIAAGQDSVNEAAGDDNSAREMAAASIALKLGSLQEIASQRGFEFLGYMLDIARAEAESIHHQTPAPDSENSINTD
jgi:hypothetical protein